MSSTCPMGFKIKWIRGMWKPKVTRILLNPVSCHVCMEQTIIARIRKRLTFSVTKYIYIKSVKQVHYRTTTNLHNILLISYILSLNRSSPYMNLIVCMMKVLEMWLIWPDNMSFFLWFNSDAITNAIRHDRTHHIPESPSTCTTSDRLHPWPYSVSSTHELDHDESAGNMSHLTRHLIILLDQFRYGHQCITLQQNLICTIIELSSACTASCWEAGSIASFGFLQTWIRPST